MIRRYVVRPRPDGGFALTGPSLPWPVHYPNDDSAVSYAVWCLRGPGGKIHVLDRKGFCILTEIVEPDRASWYPQQTTMGRAPELLGVRTSSVQ